MMMMMMMMMLMLMMMVGQLKLVAVLYGEPFAGAFGQKIKQQNSPIETLRRKLPFEDHVHLKYIAAAIIQIGSPVSDPQLSQKE